MMTEKSEIKKTPITLTIAGSDSGGGAGIQADLKTFAANQVHGTSIVTVITAQNTLSVSDIQVLNTEIIESQFEAVTEDFDVWAAKTGALGNSDVIETLCECLDRYDIGPVVVDPVMVSKHGDSLLPARAHELVKNELVPRATLITPNRYEAQILSSRDIGSAQTMKDAAREIYDESGTAVAIKGSHFEDRARDFFYDGDEVVEFSAPFIETKHVHGSGCVYSSCITAELAKGQSLTEAIRESRRFISKAIEEGRIIGEGISPVNPMHRFWG